MRPALMLGEGALVSDHEHVVGSSRQTKPIGRAIDAGDQAQNSRPYSIEISGGLVGGAECADVDHGGAMATRCCRRRRAPRDDARRCEPTRSSASFTRADETREALPRGAEASSRFSMTVHARKEIEGLKDDADG